MNGVSLLILTLTVPSCPHGEYELQARSLASHQRPQSRDGLFSNRYPNPSKVLLINTRDVRDRFPLMKFVALLISITYQKWFFVGGTGDLAGDMPRLLWPCRNKVLCPVLWAVRAPLA